MSKNIFDIKTDCDAWASAALREMGHPCDCGSSRFGWIEDISDFGAMARFCIYCKDCQSKCFSQQSIRYFDYSEIRTLRVEAVKYFAKNWQPSAFARKEKQLIAEVVDDAIKSNKKQARL